jgi:hypothetical protein
MPYGGGIRYLVEELTDASQAIYVLADAEHHDGSAQLAPARVRGSLHTGRSRRSRQVDLEFKHLCRRWSPKERKNDAQEDG